MKSKNILEEKWWIAFTLLPRKLYEHVHEFLNSTSKSPACPSYPGTTISSHWYGEVCDIQERNFAVVEKTLTLIQGVIAVRQTAMFGNFRKRMQNKIDGAMWLYALTHKFVQNNIKVIVCFSEENKHDINWNLTFMILKTLALVNIWRQIPKCLHQSFVFPPQCECRKEWTHCWNYLLLCLPCFKFKPTL